MPNRNTSSPNYGSNEDKSSSGVSSSSSISPTVARQERAARGNGKQKKTLESPKPHPVPSPKVQRLAATASVSADAGIEIPSADNNQETNSDPRQSKSGSVNNDENVNTDELEDLFRFKPFACPFTDPQLFQALINLSNMGDNLVFHAKERCEIYSEACQIWGEWFLGGGLSRPGNKPPEFPYDLSSYEKKLHVDKIYGRKLEEDLGNRMKGGAAAEDLEEMRLQLRPLMKFLGQFFEKSVMEEGMKLADADRLGGQYIDLIEGILDKTLHKMKMDPRDADVTSQPDQLRNVYKEAAKKGYIKLLLEVEPFFSHGMNALYKSEDERDAEVLKILEKWEIWREPPPDPTFPPTETDNFPGFYNDQPDNPYWKDPYADLMGLDELDYLMDGGDENEYSAPCQTPSVAQETFSAAQETPNPIVEVEKVKIELSYLARPDPCLEHQDAVTDAGADDDIDMQDAQISDATLVVDSDVTFPKDSGPMENGISTSADVASCSVASPSDQLMTEMDEMNFGIDASDVTPNPTTTPTRIREHGDANIILISSDTSQASTPRVQDPSTPPAASSAGNKVSFSLKSTPKKPESVKSKSTKQLFSAIEKRDVGASAEQSKAPDQSCSPSPGSGWGRGDTHSSHRPILPSPKGFSKTDSKGDMFNNSTPSKPGTRKSLPLKSTHNRSASGSQQFPYNHQTTPAMTASHGSGGGVFNTSPQGPMNMPQFPPFVQGQLLDQPFDNIRPRSASGNGSGYVPPNHQRSGSSGQANPQGGRGQQQVYQNTTFGPGASAARRNRENRKAQHSHGDANGGSNNLDTPNRRFRTPSNPRTFDSSSATQSSPGTYSGRSHKGKKVAVPPAPRFTPTTVQRASRESVVATFLTPELRAGGMRRLQGAILTTLADKGLASEADFGEEASSTSMKVTAPAGSNLRGLLRDVLPGAKLNASMT